MICLWCIFPSFHLFSSPSLHIRLGVVWFGSHANFVQFFVEAYCLAFQNPKAKSQHKLHLVQQVFFFVLWAVWCCCIFRAWLYSELRNHTTFKTEKNEINKKETCKLVAGQVFCLPQKSELTTFKLSGQFVAREDQKKAERKKKHWLGLNANPAIEVRMNVCGETMAGRSLGHIVAGWGYFSMHAWLHGIPRQQKLQN